MLPRMFVIRRKDEIDLILLYQTISRTGRLSSSATFRRAFSSEIPRGLGIAMGGIALLMREYGTHGGRGVGDPLN